MGNKKQEINTESIAKMYYLEHEANTQVANSMRLIYRLQGWSGAKIERRIPAIKASVWRAYAQPSYYKGRPLHTACAMAWLMQLPPKALYVGNYSELYRQGSSRVVFECFALSALLPIAVFKHGIAILASLAESKGYAACGTVNDTLDQLDEDGDRFFMPAVLDLESFKMDYYHSVSLSLQHYRKANNYTKREMALICNENINRYIAYEDETRATSMPMSVASRLMYFAPEVLLGFLRFMEPYKSYALGRHQQNLREAAVNALMDPLDLHLQRQLRDLTRTILITHLQRNKT